MGAEQKNYNEISEKVPYNSDFTHEEVQQHEKTNLETSKNRLLSNIDSSIQISDIPEQDKVELEKELEQVAKLLGKEDMYILRNINRGFNDISEGRNSGSEGNGLIYNQFWKISQLVDLNNMTLSKYGEDYHIEEPTEGPTEIPSTTPTNNPTIPARPTEGPTEIPSTTPTNSPTSPPRPTEGPTEIPSTTPTNSPTSPPRPSYFDE